MGDTDSAAGQGGPVWGYVWCVTLCVCSPELQQAGKERPPGNALNNLPPSQKICGDHTFAKLLMFC